MNIYPPGSLIAERYQVASSPVLGGMGIVYFCIDLSTIRPVALKTFQVDFLSNLSARERFLREGSIWVNLQSHTHIVRCHQITSPDINLQPFLVLELVAAESGRKDASLRSWLMPARPLSLTQSLAFAIQIARGMQYASESIPGFIHRDLKPENILVGADKLPNWQFNRLRVTDFGLASFIESLANNYSNFPTNPSQSHHLMHTRLTQGVAGTPLYMAPEQWLGEKLGSYTDIYALGCILLEMLSGHPPVEGKTIAELQTQHCNGHFHPIHQELSDSLRQVLKKCLALKSEMRFQTWEELLIQLCLVYQETTNQTVPDLPSIQDLNREELVANGWSYNSIGASYYQLSRMDLAREYHERALKIGQTEQEKELQAAALANLGNVYVGLNHYNRAINFHEQALEIARAVGDREGEADLLGNLGLAYSGLAEYQRAIDYFQRSLEIKRDIDSWQDAAGPLGNIGMVYHHLGQYHRAIDYFEQSLKLYQTTGDRLHEAKTLGNLGSAYQSLGQYQRSIAYQKQSLDIKRMIGDRHGEARSLGNLGNIYARLGDYQRAIQFHEQQLEIVRDVGDQQGEANALGNLGTMYVVDLDDPNRAIECHKQQLEITRAIGDRQGEADALGGHGRAYFIIGDHQTSIKYFSQQLEIAQMIGDRMGESEALGNLGNSYTKLGEDQRAIDYHEQSLEIKQSIRDRRGEAQALGNLGNLYTRLGDDQRAIDYIEQALQIKKAIGDKNGEAHTSLGLALQYALYGEINRAKQLMHENVELFSSLSLDADAQKIQELIAQLENSRPAKGSDEERLQQRIRDSMSAFQTAGSLQEMRQSVVKYPFMISSDYIGMLTKLLNQKISPSERPVWDKHLEWLNQITSEAP